MLRPRLIQGLIATVPLCVLFLLSGCGSDSADGFRTVTDVDTEERSEASTDETSEMPDAGDASPVQSASDSGDSMLQEPDAPQPGAPAISQTNENEGADSATKPPETIPEREPTRPGGALADSSPPTDPSADAATLAKPIKLLVPEQTFSVEGPDGALRISYDDFDLEKVLNVTIAPPGIVQHFPDWLAGLDGKRVRVRGFMYPTFQETDLGGFVLARDYGVCCFGPQGKIYHLVEVAMRKGETTDYIHARPFDVVGNFHIRPDADDEELLQLYQIEDAIVIEQ